MTKIIIAMLTFGMVCLLGCGVDQNKPEEVVQAVLKAALRGDNATVERLTFYKDTVGTNLEDAPRYFKVSMESWQEDAKTKGVSIESVLLSYKSDEQANVKVVFNNKKSTIVCAYQIKGKWYVMRDDEDVRTCKRVSCSE